MSVDHKSKKTQTNPPESNTCIKPSGWLEEKPAQKLDYQQDSSLSSFDMVSNGADVERKASSVDAPDFEYDEDYNGLIANEGMYR